MHFIIILIISFFGEILNIVLPLPIPASIYGMVILFFGLMTGLIKLESVKETGHFLIEIMPVMFIPAGVGLMTSWGMLQPLLLPISVILVVTNITVMVATGRVSQFIIRWRSKTDESGEIDKNEEIEKQEGDISYE